VGREHSEDLGVDGIIILRQDSRKPWDGVDCIHLAQNRDRWGAVLNTVMTASMKGGKFLGYFSDYQLHKKDLLYGVSYLDSDGR
jgi:hypothetical protein